jgi:hypothetical protein
MVGLCLVTAGAAIKAVRAEQPYGGASQSRSGITEPPPIPPAPPKANPDSDFYGVGYVAPWEPASGVHWRRNARLEYYARPPAPTWRWFTTGRGCGYDKGIVYGVTYPQIPTYPYGKKAP